MTTKASLLDGQTRAGVTLPEWPAECRKKEIHAALKKGEDIRVILKRERLALEKQNKRTDTCAAYYDELRRLMGAGK
ncbi:hypothetical protein G6N74_28505 [Mesorhizobium sp. CGMCC 1.15528]|uniref:Uncharacterized protein n=1 Tax=Mesorhizobium zhangyense TaxID=1776730 RepID=A0A7C9RBK3_9HYPH|nr:hypothetical protein [Mesorhizobium zhangyense]NGN45002.1 hypothetical protein [Mesorhizobium zhangyense]